MDTLRETLRRIVRSTPKTAEEIEQSVQAVKQAADRARLTPGVPGASTGTPIRRR